MPGHIFSYEKVFTGGMKNTSTEYTCPLAPQQAALYQVDRGTAPNHVLCGVFEDIDDVPRSLLSLEWSRKSILNGFPQT